jgi:dTDP-4-dehydrorhamnose 3,5-epimerase
MNTPYPRLQLSDSCFSGVRVFEPSCYHDFRGYYWTSYLEEDTPNLNFKHDKVSVSRKNVLRGIHGDNFMTKYVSCAYGEVYCVLVDKRLDSHTFGQWRWSMLTHTNRKSVLIPPGVGLGYLVMSSEASVTYKLAYENDYQDVGNQFTHKWNDPVTDIFWPISNPLLQKRDQ